MRRSSCALLFFALARAAGAQGPSADWRTLETEHFRIHYPAPFEAWALHAAGGIEEVRSRVARLVGYAPPRKIEVVVSDPAADANGEAIPFLDRPEVLLWTSPPEPESSIGDYGDWMEMVATHEVAHVAHLARPGGGWLGGLARWSPAPFGPLALRSPRWVMEGYATLIEGALTGSGRPHSVLRAMVLRQLGVQGKLPDYSDLDSSDTWLGGSVAYLVGSAFLEWLSAREGPEALPALWRRMASSRGGTFGGAFRAVFGESPEDLYDRFRAEKTALSLDEEKRATEEGIADGELWERLRGGTLALSVSPDGRHLLARRDPSPSRSYLSIWAAAPPAPVSPPGEAGYREEPPPRRILFRLPRADGFAASDPRWMPDGRAVLFSRRSPDAGGTLRWDLYRWDYAAGRVAWLTRLADTGDADPAPGGAWAAAVRGRFGRSELVRVELATGEASPIAVKLPVAEAWPVWSHPRVSPDGRRIAALLHAGRRWRLVTLPAGGGAAAEVPLDGSPVAAPAWSTDGARLFVTVAGAGTWNLDAVDPSGGSPAARLTRVVGGAFAPAPAPDGRTLYFLDFRGRGVSIRSLAPGGEPIAAVPSAAAPPPEDAARLDVASVPAARPYDVWETQAVRPVVNFSFGPSGNTVQAGADSADVIGRLHLLAVGSMGDAVGPRGGSAAAAWRGLPVALTAQVFSAIEKPGNQDLAPRPAFDEQRWGGFLDGSWSRPFSWGTVEARAGGGGTRVEAFATGETFTRGLGSGRARVAFRRTRGRSGIALDAELGGSAGATGGSGWTQWFAGGRLSGILPFVTLSASARGGGTGGSPSLFDLYAIGGAPNAILPPGLDANRIASPALPADVQSGKRFELFRAEAETAGLPVVLYAEWLRAWSAARPDPVRVVGAEVRLDRLIPAEFGRTVSFRVGGGWIVSGAPEIRAGRGYAQLVYRP